MRRIRKAKIQFISLVPAGANQLAAVYKADGSVCFGTLMKAAETFDENGELLAVVYAPDQRDSQGDIADAAVVKQMAYDFIANGGSVDINHDGKPLPAEKARVAETFLVQKSDTRFHGWKDRGGKPVDLEGAWATIIKIDDPALRKQYRNGDWAGVSMGGTAVVESEKSALDLLTELLTKTIPQPNPPKQTEPDMTPQELAAITDTMKAGFATMTTDLVKALKPETPPAPPAPPAPPVKTEPQAPVFKGDASNPRALEQHARQVEMFELRKSVDWSRPASIREFNATVAALKAEWAEADAELVIVEETPADKPVRKAGPGGNAQQLPDVGFALMGEVAKSDITDAAAGAAMAKRFNERKGYAQPAKA